MTDAQLVLGRLRAGSYAGGALSLDAGLAHAAIEEKVAGPLGIPLDDAAAGIIRVAEQRMLHAVGFVSIQRGIDPRGFTLVAAGGAGGLHGAPVGRVLGCPVVYVPRLAGVFCALGMLNSDVRHDYVRAFNCPLDDADPAEIERRFATLAAEARATLGREGFADERVRIERELDLRYHSQQWDVRVRLPDGAALDADAVRARFEDSYDRLYGHRQPETRIEIVKLRLACFGQLPELPVPDGAVALSPPEPVETRSVYIDEESGMRDVPIYAGRDLACGHLLAGPLVVEEETTTIFAGLGDRLEIDRAGNYLIRIGAEGGGNGA